MKLVVFCLVAVCCCSSAEALSGRTDRTLQRKKLEEVLRQLYDVKLTLQNSEQTLNTPPQNIDDCCCLPALQCFRANLHVQFNVTERTQKLSKLHKSLKNRLTVGGLDFCDSQNGNSTCQDCDSHPKENAREFFNRLETLIQKAITRLRTN